MLQTCISFDKEPKTPLPRTKELFQKVASMRTFQEITPVFGPPDYHQKMTQSINLLLRLSWEKTTTSWCFKANGP